MPNRDSVAGEFNYLGPMDEHPVSFTFPRGAGNLNLDPHVMPVQDIRYATAAPSLAKEGFVLVDLPVAIGAETDPEAIAKIYRPRLTEVMRDLTDAPKIIVTPPLLRWSDKTSHPEFGNSTPARYVHCDYDRDSFRALMRAVLADDPERDRWLSGRYAAYNTWRVLSPPPQDTPLALLDRSTVAPEDVVGGTIVVGGEANRQAFEASMFRYSPAHRWHYVANMSLDDTLIFLGFDSDDDELPGTPHSAFDYAGESTIPRISCEARAFVFWGG